jgi:predicted dehydrogenase
MPLPWLPQEARLGVAIVGLGGYATGQVAPAIAETRLCRLAGIVTGTPATAAEWQERHPAVAGHVYDYDTFDRIAADESIDIVYVALPNSLHAEYTIRAARAGKHVICEKPMAMSVAEGQAMIDACEDAGRQFAVGYRVQFEPHNVEAMRLGRDEVFGPVRFIEAGYGFTIGNPDQWRLRRDLAGGGALMDVGIYALQAARYVTGEEPVSVTAQEFKTDPEKFAEVDETVTWQLRFPSGCVANLSTSYNANFQRLHASATRGWLELSPAFGYGEIRGRTSEGPMDFPQINELAALMDDFADGIRNDRVSRVDGYEGLRDMRVIEAIYESIASGGAVALDG